MLDFLTGMPAYADGSFWLPPAASTIAEGVDALFYFIYWISAIFFAGIVGAMAYFLWRYRDRVPGQRSSATESNHLLEVAWIAVPTVLLLIMFAWGFKAWLTGVVPPGDALEVRVTGQKWSWSFLYPREGVSGTHLVVPVDTPVKLILDSKDVIHSFFVPDFRVKKDVLPNRYTVTWFEANRLGDFNIFCTEYCGTGHSTMLAKLKVVTPEEFRKWLDDGGDLGGKGVPLAVLGKKVFESKGCPRCHTLDGTVKIGPSLGGTYGKKAEMDDGTVVVIDPVYIRESIEYPQAKIHKGYPRPSPMPSFKGQLNDRQLDSVIAYLASLNPDAKPPVLASEAAAPAAGATPTPMATPTTH